MADTTNYPKLQEQLAQFELRFKGPLIKDSQVATFNDLLSLNSNFNYQHKIVWVIDEKANYYLDAGDGTIATNWLRIVSRAVIEQWDALETYQTSEVVYLNNILYVATQPVPVGYTPTSYPDYWEMVSGEAISVRLIFENQSSVITYTDIKNPRFEIFIGDIVYIGGDPINGPEIDPETGLAKFENVEMVDIGVVRRSDLPDNNGKAYEFAFYENEVLTSQVSGFFTIK